MSDDTKRELVRRESAEIIPLPLPAEDVVVLARNPEEMQVAQAGLIHWFDRKIAAEKAQLAECEENLGIAKRMKVRTEGWSRQIVLAKGRVCYYEKGLAALHEGYCLIPDFPVQLIAVRTSRRKPPDKAHRHWRVPDVEAEQLNTGLGQYVNPSPETYSWETGPDNQKATFTKATQFRDIDFPFKLVKPQILADLDVALRAKIFDEIGILPAVRAKARRTADPVLVGRIRRRWGLHTTVLTFLISWWVDTRTL